MKIVMLTPGTGSYHCGVCMRDNALAKEMIRLGHHTVMLPMYLPLTLDEDAASPDTPIFFGGISTWLREKVPFLRRMPRWLDRALSKRWLLKLLAGKAAKTGGPELAGMTISMLRGEEGNQAIEIEELLSWLGGAFEGKKPDAIWLSTALQAGLARRIRAQLRVPVIGFLQGEDTFLDGLGPKAPKVWSLLAERMRDADAWVAPSRYFADLMAQRLGWDAATAAQRIHIIPNGVALGEYPPDTGRRRPKIPTVGYLARFVPGKGIGLLIEAFIRLRQRMPEARLRCAGSMTAGDRVYVERLQARLRDAGADQAVEWLPNVSLDEKVDFLKSLTVFSVPATYSEAFGQYVLEAMAASTPVVLPRASAFPGIVEPSGAGVLFELGGSESQSADNLADALETLLREPERAREMGMKGRAAIEQRLSMTHLAQRLIALTSSFSDAPVGV
jgi:glycosyltransferase involved in cell wall biosynthesis